MNPINLCFVDMMHRCSFAHWDQQQHCQFSEKNRFANTCGDLRSGRWCACQDAYPTAHTTRVKEEDLPKTTRGEGHWVTIPDSFLENHKRKDEGVDKIWGDAIAKKIDNEVLNSVYKAAADGMDVEKREPYSPVFSKEMMNDFVKFASTPMGDNEFYKMYHGEYEAGRPVDSRRFSPETTIGVVKHYTMQELEKMGCGDLFAGIEHRDGRRSELRLSTGFEIVLRSRLGDIHQLIDIGHRATMDDAERWGYETAHYVMEHYKRLERQLAEGYTDRITLGNVPRIKVNDYAGNWS